MNSGLLLDVWRLFFIDQIIKTLNVFVYQKTCPSICFKTCGRAFEGLSQTFEKLSRAFKTLGFKRKPKARTRVLKARSSV